MQVTVRIGGTREAVHATLIELLAATQRTGAHTERLEDAPDVTEGIGSTGIPQYGYDPQTGKAIHNVDREIRRMASVVNQRRIR